MRVTKTKIIAAICPSTNDHTSLKDLHAAGMNFARINMSHASQIDLIQIIAT
jgi:pyruvate kinase